MFFIDGEFGNGVGHCSADYQTVVELGLNGIKDRIQKQIHSLDLTTRDGMKKRQFLRAASVACDGVIRFAMRHAELASELARAQTDPGRRQELLRGSPRSAGAFQPSPRAASGRLFRPCGSFTRE